VRDADVPALQPHKWGHYEPVLYSEVAPCENQGMSTQELIEREVAALPEALQREVYEFVLFLRNKAQEQRFDGLALSESALAKDWSTADEDQAWANL
jgi:hypothetical protein